MVPTMKSHQAYALIAYLALGIISNRVQGSCISQAINSQENEKLEHSKQTITEANSDLNYSHRLEHNAMRVRTNSLRISKLLKRSYPHTNTNTNLPNQVAFRSQKIYCRAITIREPNSQGDIIVSIQHICAPLATAPNYTMSPPVYITTTEISNLDNVVPTTSKGINCRRVMNSEFNELGEIVDSVREVCDTATTTATSTTRRSTTPKASTTTAKPLIKACRPVMNSYLNEEGKIMDVVNMVCKMEPTS